MKALGGRVMTLTCKECNNKLGSVAEEPLRALVEGEVVVEARSLNDEGPRGVRRAKAAIRQVPFSAPSLHISSGDPELLKAVSAGVPMESSYQLLDPYPAGIAILKYAYLAACIWLAEIPTSSQSDAIREALVATRDGVAVDSDTHAAISSLVQSLILVDNASPEFGAIALLEPTEAQPSWMFVLGGRLAVPWPFADLSPSDRNVARH